MPDPSPNDVVQLAKRLTHCDAGVRCQAAEQLGRLTGDSGPRLAAVALVQAVADSDERVREWVVAALEELGAPLSQQCDALATLLAHAESDVAYWAATLLGSVPLIVES